ncbi:MAG TPA: ATP-binding cassette domain-containing protein [Actinocrinis sp.]|nr:ATP-binding cassette domain-containing protein [Actinocrinis sp.]
MIEARGLTKVYGDRAAVSDLSFTVRPGIVTGFLGPNGAGKSTTMRLVLGLDAPTAGEALVNGRRYAEHPAPLNEVGALLEARAVHTGRSARNHLLALAATHAIGAKRVDRVLDLVGLSDVAGRRAGAFSLGMGQRLGIAAALLGDPGTLILDEPINGLDPEGVRWVRTLLKGLAAEGRTVFLSSHVMSELALTAEHVIVVGRGRLLADVDVAQLLAGASANAVRVRSPEAAQLRHLLAGPGVSVAEVEPGVLVVRGVDAAHIGAVARSHQLAVYELALEQASLEEAFMEMTAGAVEYHAVASSVGNANGATDSETPSERRSTWPSRSRKTR